jgi:uncharacterized protein YjbI with pentapeptide repeats
LNSQEETAQRGLPAPRTALTPFEKRAGKFLLPYPEHKFVPEARWMDTVRTITQPELNRILAVHEKRGLYPSKVRSELKQAGLNGLNLANRDLRGLDFTGASLVGATLFGSNLWRVRLFGADLRRADLRNANLTGADLRGASLNHADLCHAKLDNADLRSVVMMKMGPDGMWIVDQADMFNGGRRKEVGVDFSNCSLKGVSFSHAELEGANFSGALLQGAVFKDAKLTKPVFKGAVLAGVNLDDLAVPPEALSECILDVQPEALDRIPAIEAALERHRTWIASDGKVGAPAVLDGEDVRPLRDQFAGRAFTALSARNALAIGLDFSGCQLQGAKFDGADLREANFFEADLAGASFKSAKLAHAVFERANISTLVLLSGQTILTDFAGAEMGEDLLRAASVDAAVARQLTAGLA